MAEQEIEYELTLDDNLEFQMQTAMASPTLQRTRTGAQLLIPGSWVVTWLVGVAVVAAEVRTLAEYGVGIEVASPMELVVLLPIIVGVGLTWAIWYARQSPRWTRARIRALLEEGSTRTLVGQRRLSLTPDGVVVRSAYQETATRWEGVDRIVPAPGHVFIFTCPTCAHIVPRRAFADERQYRTFLDDLMRRQAVSRGAPPG